MTMTLPWRRTFIGVESLVAVGGVAGAWQLATGTYVPPVSDLEPLGLTSWVLPGAWLFVSVAVPSGATAWLAVRRSPLTPKAALVAAAALAVELLVQIPFVGLDPLQAVFGAIAVGMGLVAVHAIRSGGWTQPVRTGRLPVHDAHLR